MNVLAGIERRSFQEALLATIEPASRAWGDQTDLYTDLSRYGTQVARYAERFPRSQLKLIKASDLASSPQEAMVNISQFLGISHGFWSSYTFINRHKGASPRGTLGARLLASASARALGRALVPRGLRPWVAANLLGSGGSRGPKLDRPTRDAFWLQMESEIALVEEIFGQQLPELKHTMP